MKTPGQNEKIEAFDRNAPLATPSASLSLRVFSINISSVDHRRILVDKTGLSFCFISVISLFFFLEVILFHLKSNSKNSLSTRKHFLAVFFFP